jgi:hypothetical protein
LGEEVVYCVKTTAAGVESGSLVLHPQGLTPKTIPCEVAVRLTVAKPLEIGEGSHSVEDVEYSRS